MLEKFTIIDLIKTRSSSVLTVNGNTVKLNVQTAQELEYPEYVQFLFNAHDKQIAIRPCKETDQQACSFCKNGAAWKYAFKVALPTVAHMIRRLGDFDEKDTWNIPAVYLADEKALVYDLSAAYPPVSRKGGWTARREMEAAADAAMGITVPEEE